ncbi:MAG TPA: DUF188 domain-containing protein [Treponemataceae bacterium]|nr:DUF188 domain-containing protein [Treponemataceae bacterium]
MSVKATVKPNLNLNDYPFAIWIDADSCPIQVRDVIIRASKRLKIPALFVANRKIPLPSFFLLSMIIADSSPDAADDIIVEHCTKKDIVITRDIPLAHRLVEKKNTIINDRGIVYDEENIRERLSLRNFNLELFSLGLVGEKNTSFGKKELQEFSNCFDRELQKKLTTYT